MAKKNKVGHREAVELGGNFAFLKNGLVIFSVSLKKNGRGRNQSGYFEKIICDWLSITSKLLRCV
jgi:hypothetical protein